MRTGHVYQEMVSYYKINMLGSHEELCYVLVLDEVPVEPGYRRLNSYKVLITLPSGRLLLRENFSFRMGVTDLPMKDRQIA